MARGSIQIDTAKLRRLRENAGFSRRPFAEATGLSFSYVAALEIGQRTSVSPETAATFARVLGTSIEDLRAA
jgi:transcriptional regulator with XRE-family HTH domain